MNYNIIWIQNVHSNHLSSILYYDVKFKGNYIFVYDIVSG